MHICHVQHHEYVCISAPAMAMQHINPRKRYQDHTTGHIQFYDCAVRLPFLLLESPISNCTGAQGLPPVCDAQDNELFTYLYRMTNGSLVRCITPFQKALVSTLFQPASPLPIMPISLSLP